MAEVGRLFNDNQLIVAEVLQSAEVMKAAVGQLEPHMEKVEGAARQVMLATVKGDVHDIGKNLVDIVLSNNGFEVINLGIKVTERAADPGGARAPADGHRSVGLAGQERPADGCRGRQTYGPPGSTSLCWSAAPRCRGDSLTRRSLRPTDLCAPMPGDAMHGLDLVQRLTDEEERPKLVEEVARAAEKDRSEAAPGRKSPGAAAAVPAVVARDVQIPSPPDLERHLEELDLRQVWDLINPQMLFGKHLGLRGSVARLAADGDAKLAKVEGIVNEVKEVVAPGLMSARGVWRFFAARAEGERIVLSDNGNDVGSWEFPRQRGREGLCLADYVLDGDHLALFVTTASGVGPQVAAWKEEGEYLKSHTLAALAIETAEAAAEWLHRELRRLWGFADPADLQHRDLFGARYRGKRYSFGYPACPDLGGQRLLFELLGPEDIGVELTEGDMMDPEASVSAVVVHHPEARYFGIGD